jgi:hypothetical protein
MYSNVPAPAQITPLLDLATAKVSANRVTVLNLSAFDRKVSVSPTVSTSWVIVPAGTSLDLTPWLDGHGAFMGTIKADADTDDGTSTDAVGLYCWAG